MDRQRCGPCENPGKDLHAQFSWQAQEGRRASGLAIVGHVERQVHLLQRLAMGFAIHVFVAPNDDGGLSLAVVCNIVSGRDLHEI